MANAEHLNILMEGVERWNRWRGENPEIMVSLANADLHGYDLSGYDLSDTNLINADLSICDLSGANFSHANLRDCSLYGAQAVGANLQGSDLINANLTGANLYKTNLAGSALNQAKFSFTGLFESEFKNAKIGYTVFGLTNLSTCKGLENVIVENPCTIDFQTLQASKNLPKSFLLKIGLPELYIDFLPDLYQPEGIRLYPAFLSHSSINKPFARKLYDALIARGVNVFFDEKKMMPGDDLYESISKGIDYYDKMILVCSKESLADSWWVDREIDRILAKERNLFKEVGQRVNMLIPITIDDYVFNGWNGAKKEEVKRYIVGDFRNWQDGTAFEESLNKLMNVLNVDRPEIKPVSHLPRRPNP